MVTRDERIAVTKQITAAADTPAGKTTLDDDIKAATGSVAGTIEDFKIVYSKLIEIDRQNLTTTKYAPKWAPMHAEYTSIIIESKDLASKIAAYGTQFDKAVLKIATSESIAVENRKKVVQASIDKTTEFRDLSQGVQSRIDTLSSNLLNFKEEIKHFAEAEEGQLKKELEDLLIEIEKIEGEIAGLDVEIDSAAKDLKTAEIAAGIGGGFIPLFGLYLLIAGTDSILAGPRGHLERLQNQKAEKTQLLREKEARKEEIEKTLAQITAARIVLGDVADRIDNIRGALRFFDSVWSGVKGQCVEIIYYLSDEGSSSEIPEIVEVYLGMAKTPYESLANSLRLYVSGLAKFEGTA